MLKLPALLNARTTITTKLTSDSSARTSAVIPLFESVFSVNLYFLYPLRLFLMFFLPIPYLYRSLFFLLKFVTPDMICQQKTNISNRPTNGI